MRSLAATAALLLLLPPAAIMGAAPLGPAEGIAAEVSIAGKDIRYLATPGTIELKRDDGQVRGSIFYTAYRRTGIDAGEIAARPIAFLFNGGPVHPRHGSTSAPSVRSGSCSATPASASRRPPTAPPRIRTR